MFVTVIRVTSFLSLSSNPVARAETMEAYIGAVQWDSERRPTHFVRHYWYITPSLEDRPNIALLRLHETLTFNPNVQPIRLPTHGNFTYLDWSSYQLGHGSLLGGYHSWLQSMHTSILNNNLCNFAGGVTPDYEICGMNSGGAYDGEVQRFDSFIGKFRAGNCQN